MQLSVLMALIKARKIKRIKLKDYKLDGKIGLLKREGIIGEKLFYDLSSVRVSRNDTGHPKNASFKATDASDAIRRGQSLIFTLEKRIKQIKK